MSILDAHTHYYPWEVFQNPRQWALARGEHHWADCVAPTDSYSIQGWADIGTFLRDMDAAGIDKAVLLGWYWQNPETCAEQSKWYAQAVLKHPDRFLAFASINANSIESALYTIRTARENGFCGIGEIHPQVQGHTLRDACWQRVIEAAIEENLPINLHVTEPVSRDYPTKTETPLEDYVWLAAQYPEARLILAHWGGLLPFFEQNPYVRHQLANVRYDTAASPLLYDKSIFRRVLDTIGHDRILYGSDYPLRLYPRIQKEASFKPYLDEIQKSGLTPSETEALLYQNAEKLLLA